MEVTEETIQQYKAELDKIQTNLTHFQRKYQEYLGKKDKIKQIFYKNKMIIEIKNKIEWQKGLHERQEQDSKWFKLAEECKLTQREELLKQEEKIKKLKKVTRNEDQKSQVYLQNESPQYELCKIEGDKIGRASCRESEDIDSRSNIKKKKIKY